MKKYKEFIKEGNIFLGGNSYSQNADRMAAYDDLTPEERKALDDYCKMQYGKTFLFSSFEEQSTARSSVWAEKEDPKEVENQNKRDAEL